MPLADKKTNILYFPRIVVLCDRKTGHIYQQSILEKSENPINAVFGVLNDYIMESGKPTSIYVRNEKMSAIICQMCESIDVKLFTGQGMPRINEISKDMEEYFLSK